MKKIQIHFFLIILSLGLLQSHAQLKENTKWRALISIGVNAPSEAGFVNGTSAKTPNLPTINLGIQRMFKSSYGVRLDYGFNRFKNADNSPEFKINYSRINAQFVYNTSEYLGFLSNNSNFYVYLGPGFSFVKPLSGLDTKQSYFNGMAGVEFHYTLGRKVALFTDVSYIYGFTNLDNYNPTLSGLGAFNGNVLTATVGISIALSGCYTCEN